MQWNRCFILVQQLCLLRNSWPSSGSWPSWVSENCGGNGAFSLCHSVPPKEKLAIAAQLAKLGEHWLGAINDCVAPCESGVGAFWDKLGITAQLAQLGERCCLCCV